MSAGWIFRTCPNLGGYSGIELTNHLTRAIGRGRVETIEIVSIGVRSFRSLLQALAASLSPRVFSILSPYFSF